MIQLSYLTPDRALEGAEAVIFLGSRERLLDPAVWDRLTPGATPVWSRMVEGLVPGDAGASTQTWCPNGPPHRVVAGVLPDACSRHNSPAQPHAIAKLLAPRLGKERVTVVVLVLSDAAHAFAAGCAVARVLPLYDRKQESASGEEAQGAAPRQLRVAFLAPGEVPEATLSRTQAAADGIRLAGRLVDTPTAELHTDGFLAELRAMAERLHVPIEVIRGRELEEKGYGGLWGVGKAASQPPALVVLRHEPASATETVCWVGKGIVYDTGGLSIKSKTGMPGMKADMGGAAAVAGAFEAAVRTGLPARVFAIFCLAENAVGPESVRPDDILRLYSGKTVEINNTDAEGRLVLADGVAHAARHLDPDVIVDLATLTGAQLVATGRRHAAVISDDESLESRAVRAGRSSGDLVHPLPYVPEFYRAEFASKVADLKNSVKDRSNAQASCAAQFIAESLGRTRAKWLHVDLAGPANAEERGTGFGVALLLEMFGGE